MPELIILAVLNIFVVASISVRTYHWSKKKKKKRKFWLRDMFSYLFDEDFLGVFTTFGLLIDFVIVGTIVFTKVVSLFIK